jgi:hypothetical protein
VRETVESIGGRAWAETSDPGGSTFAFAIPCRRGEIVRTADASADRIQNTELRPAL